MQKEYHHGLLHTLPTNEQKIETLSDDFVILEKSDFDFPEEIKSQPPATHYLLTSARISLSLLSLVFGCAIETLQFYTGLKDIPNKLLGFIPLSPSIRATLASIYFLQAFVINRKYTNQVIENILHIIQGKYVPEWQELSSANTYKANFTSLLINAYAGFSDALVTAYYMEQQGYGLNKTTNFIIGATSSLSNLIEPYETHIFIRSQFSNTPRIDEAISINHKITGIPINLIKICGAMQDMVEGYTTAAAIAATLLGITSPSLRIPALVLSMANGLTDMMFNGKISSEAFNSLTDAIINRKYGVKEMTNLFLSFFTASIIGHAQLSVILSMLQDPEAALPPPLPASMPDKLAIALSIGTGTREVVNYTYYFYPIYKSILDTIETVLSKSLTLIQKSSHDEIATNKEAFYIYEPLEEKLDDEFVIVNFSKLNRGTLFYTPTNASLTITPPQESTPSASLNKIQR